MSNQGWTQNDSFDNWDDVSTEAPKPPTPEIYAITVVKAEAKATGTGKPAVNLEISLTGIHNGGDLPSPRKVYDLVTITKEAAFKVKQLAMAMGVAPPANNSYGAVCEFADNLVGQTAFAKTKLDTYKPKPTPENPAPEARTNAKVDRYLTQEQADKMRTGASGEGASEVAPEATAAAAGGRRRRG